MVQWLLSYNFSNLNLNWSKKYSKSSTTWWDLRTKTLSNPKLKRTCLSLSNPQRTRPKVSLLLWRYAEMRLLKNSRKERVKDKAKSKSKSRWRRASTPDSKRMKQMKQQWNRTCRMTSKLMLQRKSLTRAAGNHWKIAVRLMSRWRMKSPNNCLNLKSLFSNKKLT